MDQRAFECAAETLAAGDPDLAAVVQRHGIPVLWQRPAGFPALVLLILEQQVSLASGAAAFARVRARIGGMTPHGLLATTSAQLREDGVSRQKDRYLRALSDAVATGALDLAGLEQVEDAEVRRRLTELPGIGRWTAEAYLLACLGRPDVWPVGDRALQVGTAEVLGLPSPPGQPELEEIGRRWQPHRSTAARLIWNAYLERRSRVETSPLLLP